MTDQPGGGRTEGQASGHGRVFQAGRDQHVTEQHFHVQRSRAGVIAAGAATAVAVAAAVVAAVLVQGDPAGTGSAAARSPAGSSPAPSPAASGVVQPQAPQPSPSAAPQDAAPAWSGSMRLTYVDLDAAVPELLDNNVGASFYVNYVTGSRPEHKIYAMGGSGIARRQGEGSPSRERCAELVATQRSGNFPIRTGDRYCVRSKGGRVAAITVGPFDAATSTFTGEFVVWSAGPSSV
ncbi:hypothetical protein [Streptomyces sp. NPDC051109]|uniref:hypothetical protein n=1 Tax=Streptomyces sp. NPDC051109 TaxID=3365642 RepID=UPI001064B3B2